MAVIYIGKAGHTVVRQEDGEPRPLRHHSKHSPTGFSWGYEGSGPAELARCLLIDVLGDAQRCPVCKGTYKLPADDNIEHTVSCWACDHGSLLLPGVYQDFKRDVVAAFPSGEGWRLPRVLVEAWLVRKALDNRMEPWDPERPWAGLLIEVPEELTA